MTIKITTTQSLFACWAKQSDLSEHDTICVWCQELRIKSVNICQPQRSSNQRRAHGSQSHNVEHTNNNGLKRLFFQPFLSSIKCHLCFLASLSLSLGRWCGLARRSYLLDDTNTVQNNVFYPCSCRIFHNLNMKEHLKTGTMPADKAIPNNIRSLICPPKARGSANINLLLDSY